MSTYDFSSRYTALPHNLIKERLNELIERTFNVEGSLYLACNEKICFLLLNNLNNIIDGHFREFLTFTIFF